ncbi:MAG: NADH-quinone oxidoreductase subunit J [Candidatus Omnitrophota bacterium]
MVITVDIIILIFMILGALWAVMTRSLLRSAIALAFTSAVLSVLMFKLNAPLAAVFELSVCTGLISVLFISTISLTHPLTWEEIFQHMRERHKRFKYLPFIIVAVGIGLSMVSVKLNLPLPAPETNNDMRIVLWNLRRLDVIGQVVILLCGVFGVVILFKDEDKK